MTLEVNKLAKAINKAIGATDKDGEPVEVTPEMKTYADAIITTLQSGLVNHTTGTVTGITAPGAPLTNGAAENGLVSGLLPTTWLGVMQSGFPTADPGSLSTEATASTGYIQTAAKVNFAGGQITGQCSSTPTSPGPLVNGAGSEGTLDELSGDDWSKAVIPPTGDPDLASKIYKAIVDYLGENAEASYVPNTVTGTCPAGGGDLLLGTGVGGTIQ